LPAIRQHIDIGVNPRQVWRAITTPEGLTSWWVDEARVDGRTGGRVVLTSQDDDGNPMEERGMFLEFTPTRKIEIAWDAHGKAPTKGTRVQFQIAKSGEDTRLVLIHSGGGVLEDPAQNERMTKAWKAALQALRDTLEALPSKG